MILQVRDENGNWINIPAIQGPEGPQGIQGPAGPEGPMGPAGPSGELTEEEKAQLLNGYAKIYKIDYYVDKPISATEKVMFEEMYANAKNGIYFTAYVNKMAVSKIDYGSTYLDLYVDRAQGGTQYYRYNFNANGELTTTKHTNSGGSTSLDSYDITVLAGYSPSGQKSNVAKDLKYIKNNYYTKTEVDGLLSNVPEGGDYATMEEVEAKGYLTEEQVKALINETLGTLSSAEEGEY